jgi:hypothetical protein
MLGFDLLSDIIIRVVTSCEQTLITLSSTLSHYGVWSGSNRPLNYQLDRHPVEDHPGTVPEVNKVTGWGSR